MNKVKINAKDIIIIYNTFVLTTMFFDIIQFFYNGYNLNSIILFFIRFITVLFFYILYISIDYKM